MRFRILLFLLVVITNSISQLSAEQLHDEDCATHSYSINGETALATAGIFSNWRGSSDSVRVRSKELFQQAFAQLSRVPIPQSLCPECCELPAHPSVTFHSQPRAFRSDYDDKAMCDRFHGSTSRSPLLFNVTLENSLEKLTDWISDFSQGENSEGEKLYQLCPGDCSPQYSYTITPFMDTMSLEASVICGPARDKDDDMYILRYGYMWRCRLPSEVTSEQ